MTTAPILPAELDRCGRSPLDIINLKNLHQIVDKKELTAIIENVLVNHNRDMQLSREEKKKPFDYLGRRLLRAELNG